MGNTYINDLCKVKIYQMFPVTGAPCENYQQFFFYCDKYTDNKGILFNSLNRLPSNINYWCKSSDFLTYQENTTIFKQKIYNCLNDLKNQHTSPKVFVRCCIYLTTYDWIKSFLKITIELRRQSHIWQSRE